MLVIESLSKKVYLLIFFRNRITRKGLSMNSKFIDFLIKQKKSHFAMFVLYALLKIYINVFRYIPSL